MIIDGCELTINTWDGRHGCFLEILERTKEQLDAMLSHHSKVLVVLFQLTPASHTVDNKEVSNFVRKLRKKLTARYKLTRMGYLWVREMDTDKGLTDKQHYHCALILDANRVRYPANILKEIERIWCYWDHPKPYTPKNCYYLIGRGDTATYADAFLRLSYLSKTRTKGNRPKQTNDFSASRIKAKPQS